MPADPIAAGRLGSGTPGCGSLRGCGQCHAELHVGRGPVRLDGQHEKMVTCTLEHLGCLQRHSVRSRCDRFSNRKVPSASVETLSSRIAVCESTSVTVCPDMRVSFLSNVPFRFLPLNTQ